MRINGYLQALVEGALEDNVGGSVALLKTEHGDVALPSKEVLESFLGINYIHPNTKYRVLADELAAHLEAKEGKQFVILYIPSTEAFVLEDIDAKQSISFEFGEGGVIETFVANMHPEEAGRLKREYIEELKAVGGLAGYLTSTPVANVDRAFPIYGIHSLGPIDDTFMTIAISINNMVKEKGFEVVDVVGCGTELRIHLENNNLMIASIHLNFDHPLPFIQDVEFQDVYGVTRKARLDSPNPNETLDLINIDPLAFVPLYRVYQFNQKQLELF